MSTKISQTDLIAAICKELDRQGISQITTCNINAIILAADSLVLAFSDMPSEPKPVEPKPVSGLHAWLASDDVGASSKYLASVLSEQFCAPYAHPHDVSDFCRCVGLLKAVPDLRPKLRAIGKTSRQWDALLQNWQFLEELIADTTSPKSVNVAYKLIRNCVQ